MIEIGVNNYAQHEESIANYDRRRNVMRKLFKAMRIETSPLSESEWDKTTVDFLRVNYAELEARVLAHVIDNGGVLPSELSVTGRAERVPDLQSIKMQNIKGRPKHG